MRHGFFARLTLITFALGAASAWCACSKTGTPPPGTDQAPARAAAAPSGAAAPAAAAPASAPAPAATKSTAAGAPPVVTPFFGLRVPAGLTAPIAVGPEAMMAIYDHKTLGGSEVLALHRALMRDDGWKVDKEEPASKESQARGTLLSMWVSKDGKKLRLTYATSQGRGRLIIGRPPA